MSELNISKKRVEKELTPLKKLLKRAEKYDFDLNDQPREDELEDDDGLLLARAQDNRESEHNPLQVYARAIRNQQSKKFLNNVINIPKKIKETEDLYDIEESIQREEKTDKQAKKPINAIWTGKPINPVEFDVNRIRPDYTIALFGKRREGKSFLMRWILYQMRHIFIRGLVFSHTKHNRYWQKHIPNRYIHPEFRQNVLLKFMDQQKKYYEQWLDGAPINPFAFVIFDDVLGPDLYYDSVLRRFFTEGRHYKMFVIISTQYVKGLPPSIRANTDLAISFRMIQENSKEALAKDYFTRVPKQEAYRLMDTYAVRYQDGSSQFLAIDTDDSLANGLDDMFSIGMAEDPGPFILGCKEWWGDEINQVDQLYEREKAFTEDNIEEEEDHQDEDREMKRIYRRGKGKGYRQAQ